MGSQESDTTTIYVQMWPAGHAGLETHAFSLLVSSCLSQCGYPALPLCFQGLKWIFSMQCGSFTQTICLSLHLSSAGEQGTVCPSSDCLGWHILRVMMLVVGPIPTPR